MFSSSQRVTLIALIASAVAVSATPSLSLKVAGPDAVTDISNFKVKATITNTGDEILKILNDPSSPLSNLPTNTFQITNNEGATPAFAGVRVKYVPSTAISEGAVTVLTPGQSVEVDHDLSEAYSFSESGEGAYSVEANNLFYIVDSENKPIPLYAEADGHTAKLMGKLTVVRHPQVKRATFNKCSASQKTALDTAASNAQKYAAKALSYLKDHTSATPRYTTWFGAYNSGRHSTVQSHFKSISGNTFSKYKFDCTCTDRGTYAYVYPNDLGTVYLCGAFWNAPATGTDSKAGTLVHESSHFTKNGGTQDHVYGQSACKQLARSNPGQAVQNADSHEYFAENTPAQS